MRAVVYVYLYLFFISVVAHSSFIPSHLYILLLSLRVPSKSLYTTTVQSVAFLFAADAQIIRELLTIFFFFLV